MSGLAMHLAVADRMIGLAGDKIKNIPLFFSGSVVPDAIQFKPNFEREEKLRTHFWYDLDGEPSPFTKPENIKRFNERVAAFLTLYYRTGAPDADLYTGFVTHNMTDVQEHIHIHKMYEKIPHDPNMPYKDFFSAVMKDIGACDRRVTADYTFGCDLNSTLDVWDYEIKGYVGKEDITAAKRELLDVRLKKNDENKPTVYFHWEDALNFIDNTARNIVSMLSNGTELPKIL